MLLIGIAWIYVVLMVALVQGTGPDGHWLGAIATLLFWGALPVAILAYLFLAPARRRRRLAQAEGSVEPGGGSHPAGDPVPAEREVP